jgi:hypothetical protein
VNNDLRLERVTVRTYRVRNSRFAPTRAVRLDQHAPNLPRASRFAVPAVRGERNRNQ